MSVLNSNGFTYEGSNSEHRLETYEWDNVWWEKCNTPDVPRVLHIGDSISCGLRPFLNETAENKLFFDGFGTSKALDNPFFVPSLELFHSQQVRCDAIIFNNGLHGFHLKDETEYREHYEKMILSLKDIFTDIPLILLLTTDVKPEEEKNRVPVRNKVVCELAQKYSLPVIDMYSVSQRYADKQFDGVHFEGEAYKGMAKALIDSLLSIVPDILNK